MCELLLSSNTRSFESDEMIIWAIVEKYDDEPVVGPGVFSLSFSNALNLLEQVSSELTDPRSTAEIMTFQFIGKPDDFDGLVFKKKPKKIIKKKSKK